MGKGLPPNKLLGCPFLEAAGKVVAVGFSAFQEVISVL